MAAKHFAFSKQPDSDYQSHEGSAIAILSSSCHSKSTSVYESETNKTGVKRQHLCGIRTDDIPRSLLHVEPHLQQQLSCSREQQSLLLVSDKTKHLEEKKKALNPPPGFKNIDNSFFKPTTEHSASFPYSSSAQLHSSKPLPAAQPSLFSIVMCRQYTLHHACVHLQHTRKSHQNIMKTMLLELESLAKFNFNDSSPDDIVRNKQTEGFNRKYD